MIISDIYVELLLPPHLAANTLYARREKRDPTNMFSKLVIEAAKKQLLLFVHYLIGNCAEYSERAYRDCSFSFVTFIGN